MSQTAAIVLTAGLGVEGHGILEIAGLRKFCRPLCQGTTVSRELLTGRCLSHFFRYSVELLIYVKLKKIRSLQRYI